MNNSELTAKLEEYREHLHSLTAMISDQGDTIREFSKEHEKLIASEATYKKNMSDLAETIEKQAEIIKQLRPQ